MIKLLMFYLLICPSGIYSQNFEFRYIRTVCVNSELIEERSYDSKTETYKEINYDRNTFHDTTNIYREIFEAHIPLAMNNKKDIYSLVKKLTTKENTLVYGAIEKENYTKINLFLYENGQLLNDNNKYLYHRDKAENFDNLLSFILNFLKSSEEYKRVFYWDGEKK